MFKVTVNKTGSTFTGGLYPESLLDTAIANLERDGFTVLAVTRQVSI